MNMAREPLDGSSRPHQNAPPVGRARACLQSGWAVGVLACCACVAPEPAPPLPFQEVAAFSAQGSEPTSTRWWQAWQDPRLEADVQQGLGQNWTLRIAWERLQAARALAQQERSARRLTLDAVGGGRVFDGDEPLPEQEIEAGLQASFEVDLWGRIASEIRAADWEVRATAEDYRAAAITLSAEIATVLYRLEEARAQQDLVRSQLETNRNVQQVIENRFAIGQSNSADVLRQRQLVQATEEQQLAANAAVELLEHQRAVLLGHPPQENLAGIEARPLPDLPPLPTLGLPADLLQRRPDVRAAFARLRSADASVAAAVQDRYPRIDLSGSAVTSGRTASDLFSTWLGTLTGELVGPLIDGGRRRRVVEQAVALRREAVAQYGAVVLEAFQEVEDLLVQERWQERRLENLTARRDLARATYTELRNQYRNGAGDFIDVLVALRDQQALERNWLEARLLRIEVRIALHRALAGGWEIGEPDPYPAPEAGPSVQASAAPSQ